MLPSDKGIYILGLLCQGDAFNLAELQHKLLILEDYPWIEIDDSKLSRDLHFMVRDGLTERKRESTPPQTLYRITEKGQAILESWLRISSLEKRRPTFPFDLVVFSFTALSTRERKEKINRHRTAILATHNRLVEQLQKLPASQPIQQVIIKHHLHSIQADLDWLDEIEEKLIN